VSYKSALTEDELVQALLTGKIPPRKRPHLRTLLDEATPAQLKGLVSEVSQWAKSGRVEKNISKIAAEIGSTTKIAN
jgi:hypothetical protein